MVRLLRRHVIIGTTGAALVYVFWLSRPDWTAEMRFWKAVGDASLIFLYVALMLGPAARFASQAGKLLSYRRELGIWFGIFAILHTVLILNSWVRWDIERFMGYEFVPALNRMVRLESGFGVANLLGLLALVLALPLMATSADWAVRALGGSAWKFLHYGVYTIFYLVVMHTAYFMYIHFTASFHRTPPPNANWFQIPFAVITAVVLALQIAAFIKTARRKEGVRGLPVRQKTSAARRPKTRHRTSGVGRSAKV